MHGVSYITAGGALRTVDIDVAQKPDESSQKDRFPRADTLTERSVRQARVGWGKRRCLLP